MAAMVVVSSFSAVFKCAGDNDNGGFVLGWACATYDSVGPSWQQSGSFGGAVQA
jgi:hypothetical protein